MSNNDKLSAAIDDATQYLETGGLGEVIGMAQISWEMGHKKVQMDTDMAIALCILADEYMKTRSTGRH